MVNVDLYSAIITKVSNALTDARQIKFWGTSPIGIWIKPCLSHKSSGINKVTISHTVQGQTIQTLVKSPHGKLTKLSSFYVICKASK